MKLNSALKKASTKVWNELTPLANSQHKIFEIREEGLTSLALKQLSNSKCDSINFIDMISANREKTDGYDFQISLGNDKAKEYIHFFIQAKRLNGYDTSSGYNHIQRKQTENLIKYSRRKGVPTYAFYNHLTDDKNILREHYNSVTSYNKKWLGITLASAHAIKIAQDYKFTTLHRGNSKKLPRNIYSPRELANVFSFYKNRMNMAVPLHELSYLTLSLAKKVNTLYQKSKGSVAPFFFFYFPGIENLIFGDDELIPIIRTDSQEIISGFLNNDYLAEDRFSPRALVIIKTDD